MRCLTGARRACYRRGMESPSRTLAAARRLSRLVITGEGWYAAWSAAKPFVLPVVASALAGWRAVTEGLALSVVAAVTLGVFASVLVAIVFVRLNRAGQTATATATNFDRSEPAAMVTASRLAGQVADTVIALDARLSGLEQRVAAVERQAAVWEKMLGKIQEAFEATRNGLRAVARVQEARAVEIKINRLLVCVPEVPPMTELSARAALHASLKAAEAYIQRVHDRSREWLVLGPSPYEGFMADAERIAEIELDHLDEKEIVSDEIRTMPLSSKRKYMEAVRKIEHTKQYLELRRSTANKIQSDSADDVYHVLSKITTKDRTTLLGDP